MSVQGCCTVRVKLFFLQWRIIMDLQHSEVATPQSLLNNLSRPASCMCKASLICNMCLFLEPSIIVVFSHLLVSPCLVGNRWFFCLSSSDSCLVLTDSCLQGPLCFPNVLQTTTAGDAVYHSRSPVRRFLILDLGQLSLKGRVCAETSPNLVFFCKFLVPKHQDFCIINNFCVRILG